MQNIISFNCELVVPYYQSLAPIPPRDYVNRFPLAPANIFGHAFYLRLRLQLPPSNGPVTLHWLEACSNDPQGLGLNVNSFTDLTNLPGFANSPTGTYWASGANSTDIVIADNPATSSTVANADRWLFIYAVAVNGADDSGRYCRFGQRLLTNQTLDRTYQSQFESNVVLAPGTAAAFVANLTHLGANGARDQFDAFFVAPTTTHS
eukprot:TRINITY_DN2401_c0_g1_i8.p1 TRINITY_DN2401_c0_g1~~TRINITY_DN2401_c0_g1_i8.p1  ORF type:complete len:206 (-),score=15.31 TRINITY_DN2401_c0_g1_i8:29-646(-)